MFATKREGVLVVGSAMVNTGIYALMVGFTAGVIGTGVREVGSRLDLKRVGRVVGVLICGKGMDGG